MNNYYKIIETEKIITYIDINKPSIEALLDKTNNNKFNTISKINKQLTTEIFDVYKQILYQLLLKVIDEDKINDTEIPLCKQLIGITSKNKNLIEINNSKEEIKYSELSNIYLYFYDIHYCIFNKFYKDIKIKNINCDLFDKFNNKIICNQMLTIKSYNSIFKNLDNLTSIFYENEEIQNILYCIYEKCKSLVNNVYKNPSSDDILNEFDIYSTIFEIYNNIKKVKNTQYNINIVDITLYDYFNILFKIYMYILIDYSLYKDDKIIPGILYNIFKNITSLFNVINESKENYDNLININSQLNKKEKINNDNITYIINLLISCKNNKLINVTSLIYNYYINTKKYIDLLLIKFYQLKEHVKDVELSQITLFLNEII